MLRPLLFPIILLITFCLKAQVSNEPILKQLEANEVEELSIESGFYLLEVDTLDTLYKGHFFAIVQRKSKNLFIVKIPPTISINDLGDSKIYHINNEWKMSPTLSLNVPKENKDVTLSIETTNLNHFVSQLNQQRIVFKQIHSHNNIVLIDISSNHIDTIIKSEYVVFIDVLSQPKVESNFDELDLNVNTINLLKQSRPDLNGMGQIVSIKEQMFDTTDIDIQNRHRLFNINSQTIAKHATEMATLIGGAGNNSKASLGVAPRVQFSSSDFTTLLPDDNTIYVNNSIFVQNHSYGLTEIENFYGMQAKSYDQSTIDIPELIHVFSVGNKGEETPVSGTYNGISNYANLTGNFKTAKNVLTVGAIDKEKKLESRSSSGPTYDGRLKPELVAYAPQGTSDAAALVSGVSTILQQAFLTQEGIFPSSDLIRSLLVVGADDIGPLGIDFKSGYGSMNANRSLSIIENNGYIQDVISENETKEYSISVPLNTKEFKVALTWNDLPANAGDETKALINDLNILLSNDNEQWHPWVLNSYPHLDSLTQAPKRRVDNLNTIELITIDNPVAGDYTISVSTSNLQSSQSYSISFVNIQKNHFFWTYPSEIDNLESNTFEYIRWQNTWDVPVQDIEFNLNNSGWTPISLEDNNTNDGFAIWDTKDLYGTCKLRAKVNDNLYESDDFTISEQILPRIAFNCDDGIGIEWDLVPNATSYTVKGLETISMQELLSTETNTTLLMEDSSTYPYVSITPHFQDEVGLRGQAINYQSQSVKCYYINFFALLNDENNTDIFLDLSTFQNVGGFSIERVNADNTITVIDEVSSPLNTLSFNFLDSDVQEGLNVYRAKIVLNDGTETFTEEFSIVLPSQNFLDIFPNPTDESLRIDVRTKGNNLTFRLMDLTGRLIKEDILDTRKQSFKIPAVSSGVYVGLLLKDGKLLNSKKIIVRF